MDASVQQSCNTPSAEAAETGTQTRYKEAMKRIAKHEEDIQSIARNNNAANLACCLPVEVLTAIFSILALEDGRFCEDPWVLIANGSRWFTVTHVCRTWRMAALGCPTLWTDLSHLPKADVERAIARSGTLPLDWTYEEESLSGSKNCGHVLQECFSPAFHCPQACLQGLPGIFLLPIPPCPTQRNNTSRVFNFRELEATPRSQTHEVRSLRLFA